MESTSDRTCLPANQEGYSDLSQLEPGPLQLTATCAWFRAAIAIHSCPERRTHSHRSHGIGHSSYVSPAKPDHQAYPLSVVPLLDFARLSGRPGTRPMQS